MGAYGSAFARIYDQEWGFFADRVAAPIAEFYESLPVSRTTREMLDLCCGTGQLVHRLLEHGYRVTGLDLSADMLHYAREHNRSYIDCGQATFVQGDAATFTLDYPVGLVTSTFDSLNHLGDLSALASCFRSVRAVLARDGVFIFDLNTRAGLRRQANFIQVRDTEEMLVVHRGIYDGQSDRAQFRISGFVKMPDGRYERFEETPFNTVYDLDAVQQELREQGFQSAYFARIDDLATPITNPDEESRVFVVARGAA